MATSSSLGPTQSGPKAQVHPFAILSISDYLAKHTLRSFTQPLAGILLGRSQDDRMEIETAFEIKFKQDTTSGSFVPDQAWVDERYQQFIDVYGGQSPLSFVGWWYMAHESHVLKSLRPPSGSETSQPSLVAIQVDTSRLASSQGSDQLPFEVVTLKNDSSPSDGSMEIDKPDSPVTIDYEISTAETELIAMEYVAKSPANALAISAATTTAQNRSSGPADDEQAETLTAEEEEMISFLTTKINAIRMLKERIHSITSYIDSLPPSYLTDASIPPEPSVPLEYLQPIVFLGRQLPLLDPNSELSKSSPPELILEATRDILTQLENISLPPQSHTQEHQPTIGNNPQHNLAQDVQSGLDRENLDTDDLIINLMSQLTRSSKEMKDLGSSFAVLDSAKQRQQRDAMDPFRPPPKSARPEQMFHPADAEMMMDDD